MDIADRVNYPCAMKLDDLKHAQRERVLYLDRCLTWRGTSNRRDLVERFGISHAQAALDFRAYLAVRADRAPPVYDAAQKTYVAAEGHEPLLPSSEQDGYSVLADASEDGIPTALPALPKQSDARVCARLHGAIRDRRAVHVCYTSISSGADEGQWIAPVRFISDGESVHVRAFSFKHDTYRHYAPIRVDPNSTFRMRDLDTPLPKDVDWLTRADVYLRPKSGLSSAQAAVVRKEYGFNREYLVITTRKALEFFITRRWGLENPGTRLEIACIVYDGFDGASSTPDPAMTRS